MFSACAEQDRAALVGYLPVGYPDPGQMAPPNGAENPGELVEMMNRAYNARIAAERAGDMEAVLVHQREYQALQHRLRQMRRDAAAGGPDSYQMSR